jgi:ligand-binding sensor domain-containing protein
LLLAFLLLAVACNGAGRIVPTWTASGGASTPSEGVGAESSGPVQEQGPQPAIPPQSASVRFDRYSVEEGLSESAVDCVVQDSRGFVWIGTEDGLNRFDGYSFQIYRHDPQDPNSLSSSNIKDLYADDDGPLWIATLEGLNRYDPQLGLFSRYQHDPDDNNSLAENLITAVYGDRAGMVWVGTRSQGLDRLDPESGTWRHYQYDKQDPHSLGDDYVTDILQDSTGRLWVATANGLNRLEQERAEGEPARFVRYLNDPDNPLSLSGNAITALDESRSGDLWVATAGGGLNRWDHEVDSFVRYRHDPSDRQTPGSDLITSVVEDGRGMVWLATDSGVDRFDPVAGQWRHYRRDPGDSRSLSYDVVAALYEDESGGIWIGTRGGGLNRHDWRRERFVHYRSQPNEPNSLGHDMLWAFYEDSDGVLWVGTDGGGLSILDRQADRWYQYQHEPGVPNSLANDSVTSILEDSTGRIWVATFGGGLARVQEPRGKGQNLSFEHFRSVPGDPHSLSSDWVWKVYEDRDGNLWVGTTNGLNLFDWETEQFTRFYHGADDPESPQKNNVGGIYRDRTGDMWVATQGGLYRFNPDESGEQKVRYTAYQHDPEDDSSLSNNIVFSMHEDGDGVMWFGTWGGGLNRFDRETEAFTHYRTRDGLPNDVIYGILEETGSGDGAGPLWLSTNNGLSRFDPKTGTFANYDTDDGLQSIEFNFGAYHRSESGEMFFGGINGFNAFYPRLVSDNTYVPPIVLTSLTQGGQPAQAGEASAGESSVGQSPSTLSEISFRCPITSSSLNLLL